jgi:outer membrane protein TolC
MLIKSSKKTTVRALTLAALGIAIAGCSVSPEALKTSEVRNRVQGDQFKLFAAQDPIFEPISFEEALARSLKYNLDLRLKLMESAQRRGLSDLANFDMLPNLLVSAGYTNRNNISGSHSYEIDELNDEIIDNVKTNDYSGSQERNRRIASAEFTWSALDFGIGYYSAKQAANEVLIAEERRRRVVQNILSDVRSAYWRALGAQRLVTKADELIAQVQSSLEKSRRAESEGLVSPKQALNYQRMLLDAVDLLDSRRTELALAKRELAALMNVTPGTEFTLVEADEPNLKPAPLNVAELEELALQQRPELRQEDYKTRISADEARKQMISLLPNISFNMGYQYDSNKYLYNNDWVDTGARINMNLFKLFSYNAVKGNNEAQVKVDDARRMALSIAVLTQVRVAVERYNLSLSQLDLADESFLVDQRMASFAEAAQGSEMNAELEVIRAKTRALNSEFKRYGAYAAAQAAFGRIYNSVGFEVIPTNLNDEGQLTEIGAAITEYVRQVEDNFFAHADVIVEEVPAVAIQLKGVHSSTTAMVNSGVKGVLARNRFEVDSRSPYVLLMEMDVKSVVRGVRPASWKISLVDAYGKTVDTTTYTSTLTANPSARVIQTFAESAVIAKLGEIRGWLEQTKI